MKEKDRRSLPAWIWIGGIVGLGLMYGLRVVGRHFGPGGLALAMGAVALTLLLLIMRYGFRAMDRGDKSPERRPRKP